MLPRCRSLPGRSGPLARLSLTYSTSKPCNPLRLLPAHRSVRPISTVPCRPTTKRRRLHHYHHQQNAVIVRIPSRYLTTPSLYETPKWPAPSRSMSVAREFLKACATSAEPVLIVPDKDGDGLCAATIIQRTLISLGRKASSIGVRFVSKGRSVHDDCEREAMERMEVNGKPVKWFILVDHGSQSTRRIVRDDKTLGVERKVLIVDHQVSSTFPQGATVLSSSTSPPVTTSSLLSYLLVCPLIYPDNLATVSAERKAASAYAWLAVCGTVAERGESFKFADSMYPPELQASVELARNIKWIKKFVALINAPRRHENNDPTPAWELLQLASTDGYELEPNGLVRLLNTARAEQKKLVDPYNKSIPAHIRRAKRLVVELDEMRRLVGAATEFLMLKVPSITRDGLLAVTTVKSAHLVHPVMATMWSMSSTWYPRSRLVAVLCANEGYEGGKVPFSIRLMRTPPARKEMGTVKKNEGDVIALLRDYALRDAEFASKLREAEDKGEVKFVNGHREAAGGLLTIELWDMFVERCLKLWQPPETSKASAAPVKGSVNVIKGAPLKTPANTESTWKRIEERHAKEEGK